MKSIVSKLTEWGINLLGYLLAAIALLAIIIIPLTIVAGFTWLLHWFIWSMI